MTEYLLISGVLAALAGATGYQFGYKRGHSRGWLLGIVQAVVEMEKMKKEQEIAGGGGA